MHAHTHTHAHTHAHMHVHIHIHIHIRMHVLMHMHMHMHMHEHIHVHVHICTCTSTSARAHAHAHAHEVTSSPHLNQVTNVSFSHCGGLLLSGSRDGTARIWSVGPGARPRLEQKLVAHQSEHGMSHRSAILAHTGQKPLALWVDMVAWSADDCIVFTAETLNKQTREQTCVSSCLRVWTTRGALLHTFDGSSQPVFVLQPHPLNPAILASAGYDGTARTWDVRRGVPLAAISAPTQTTSGEPLEEVDALLVRRTPPPEPRS